MANYEATSRSNYFRVKDTEAFEAWAHSRGLILLQGNKAEDQTGIAPEEMSDGDWPSTVYDEAEDDFVEIDFIDELAGHLADGEVAVLMSAGHEKLRYVSGFATAITSEGEVARVSLTDIYDKLKEAGYTGVTPAEY